MNRQRTTSGWPTGSPVCRDSFGGRTVGFDAASSGMRATSGARTTNAFGRRKSAASGLSSGTRATAEGWRAGARTTAPPFGVGRRIAKPPFGEVTRSASETNRLRAIRADAWVAFGWIHLRSSRPSGWLGRGRGASFGRGRSHDAIDSSGALRGTAGTVAERGDLRVVGTDTGGHRPSGPRPASTPEPDKAETLCLPLDVRVTGTPAGLLARRNAQQVWAARKRAAASETCRPKTHGSIERCAAETLRGCNGLLGGTKP